MAKKFLVWVTQDFEGFDSDAYDQLKSIESVLGLDNGDTCLLVETEKDMKESQAFALFYGTNGFYSVKKYSYTTSPDWLNHWDYYDVIRFWRTRNGDNAESEKNKYVEMAQKGELICTGVNLPCSECPYSGTAGCPDYGPFGLQIESAYTGFLFERDEKQHYLRESLEVVC